MGGIMGIAEGGLSDGWHHGHHGAFVSERLGLRAQA